MPEPTRPTDPAIVMAPLQYLYAHCPTTMDAAFRHVLLWTNAWLLDDPLPPDPPPDGVGDKPLPPPPPPPTPAYPIAVLLDWICDCDDEDMEWAWMGVQLALSDWLTTGPFGS